MSAPDRAFVRIEEGLVHLRRMDGRGSTPLVLLHASPGSSRGLEPLMIALHDAGAPPLIAPDTLGNGDSAGATPPDPDIGYFADAVLRTLDALGIERFHLYGAHTGARIACEIAAVAPARVLDVIFDGIDEYSAEMQALLLEGYAPEMVPDDYGRQFVWAFNFVRDQALHFPYFLRDPEHRLLTRPVPDARELHAATLEVLKGLESYHKPYHAAFRYPARARLAAIGAPATFLAPADELPHLRARAQELATLPRDGRVASVGPGLEAKAAAMLAHLAPLG